VNFSLVTTVALTLANPFNMGMAIGATGQVGQVQVGDVVLAQSPNDGDIVLEEVIGPNGGDLIEIIYEDNVNRLPSSGAAVLYLYENALSQEAKVGVVITNEDSSNYPEIDNFESIYPIDKIRHIGPLMTITIPMEGINLNYPSEGAMFIASPSYNRGERDNVATRDIRFEVRIYRKDGTFSFYTQRFGRFGFAAIDLDFLQANLGSDLPETLTISIQAVDISDALPNPDDFLPPSQHSNDGSNITPQSSDVIYPQFDG
jgi:hypothetical protein